MWKCRFNSLFMCLACIQCAGLALSPISAARGQESNRTLINAKRVITADGAEFSPGQILIVDGEISFVGEAIELAMPARTLDVHTVMPGIVNASSNAGLVGGGSEVAREITPEFETRKSIDWGSRDFKELLDAGITTVQILPRTESVFAGLACIAKSTGMEASPSSKPAAVLAICDDPTSGNRNRTRPDSIFVRQPNTRMGVVWIVRQTLHKAAQGELSDSVGAQVKSVLSDVVQGELPVVSVSRTDFDIRSALQMGEKYGFKPVVCGGDEVYSMVDEFAASGSTLIYTALTVNATASALRGTEGTELRWNVPGQLLDAQIPFCLAGSDLLDQARFATRFGLPASEAIKAITHWPAKIIGMDDRIGTIAMGKDADLIAFSGDPLEPTSRLEWTMISGEVVEQ